MRFELPAMLSYHSTWDDADYIPQVPSRRHGVLARIAGAFVSRINAARTKAATRRELAAMSDRELSDIGLSRYDMNRLFDPAFLHDFESRRV